MSFSDPKGADLRKVHSRTHDGQSARVVTLVRDYATTADDLWHALTDPQRLARWFLPLTGELKPGGRYQLEGNAGGVIERCEPPATLQLTWEFGDNVSWVIVRLAGSGETTTLTLEHIMPVDEGSQAHWDKYGPGATGVGWELGLLTLGIHFSSKGSAIDVAEYESWMVSDDGKAFAKHCAASWGDAHSASGADAAEARAMAARTGAFYAGE